jgi:hypothetical protein
MIRVNPTKVLLKNEDLKEYEQVKIDWDRQRNIKKNIKIDVVDTNTNTNDNKKAAARQRIGLFEG